MEKLTRQSFALLANMPVMSDPKPTAPAKKVKINFRAIPEVDAQWEMMNARYRTDPAIPAGERKLSKQDVASAIIVWLNEQPKERQAEIVRRGLELLAGLESARGDVKTTLATSKPVRAKDAKSKGQAG